MLTSCKDNLFSDFDSKSSKEIAKPLSFCSNSNNYESTKIKLNKRKNEFEKNETNQLNELLHCGFAAEVIIIKTSITTDTSKFFASQKCLHLLNCKGVVYYAFDVNKDFQQATNCLMGFYLYSWRKQKILLEKCSQLLIPQVLIDGVPVGSLAELEDLEEDEELDLLFTRQLCPNCFNKRSHFDKKCSRCDIKFSDLLPRDLPSINYFQFRRGFPSISSFAWIDFFNLKSSSNYLKSCPYCLNDHFYCSTSCSSCNLSLREVAVKSIQNNISKKKNFTVCVKDPTVIVCVICGHKEIAENYFNNYRKNKVEEAAIKVSERNVKLKSESCEEKEKEDSTFYKIFNEIVICKGCRELWFGAFDFMKSCGSVSTGVNNNVAAVLDEDNEAKKYAICPGCGMLFKECTYIDECVAKKICDLLHKYNISFKRSNKLFKHSLEAYYYSKNNISNHASYCLAKLKEKDSKHKITKYLKTSNTSSCMKQFSFLCSAGCKSICSAADNDVNKCYIIQNKSSNIESTLTSNKTHNNYTKEDMKTFCIKKSLLTFNKNTSNLSGDSVISSSSLTTFLSSFRASLNLSDFVSKVTLKENEATALDSDCSVDNNTSLSLTLTLPTHVSQSSSIEINDFNVDLELFDSLNKGKNSALCDLKEKAPFQEMNDSVRQLETMKGRRDKSNFAFSKIFNIKKNNKFGAYIYRNISSIYKSFNSKKAQTKDTDISAEIYQMSFFDNDLTSRDDVEKSYGAVVSPRFSSSIASVSFLPSSYSSLREALRRYESNNQYDVVYVIKGYTNALAKCSKCGFLLKVLFGPLSCAKDKFLSTEDFYSFLNKKYKRNVFIKQENNEYNLYYSEGEDNNAYETLNNIHNNLLYNTEENIETNSKKKYFSGDSENTCEAPQSI